MVGVWTVERSVCDSNVMPSSSQHVKRALWRFRKSVWDLSPRRSLCFDGDVCPHEMETFLSEKLDSLLIFTPKHLRLAPFDQ